MKRIMRYTLPVLLCLTLVLCGCGQQEEEAPQITESLVWEKTPPLDHGVLEYEKLEVQPWYCGRLEFTGGSRWAETELGYYYYDSSEATLYYADKADLSNWVPVCNKPACLHTMNIRGCNARLGGNEFLIRNGRIYYVAETGGKNETLYLEEGSTTVIASRALDGTDLRMDYVIDEAIQPNGGGGSSGFLTPTYWMQNIYIFNTDGTYTARVFRTTREGTELIAERKSDEQPSGSVTHRGFVVNGMLHFGYNGDTIFFNEFLGDITETFRYGENGLETLDISGYELLGKYLSGNTLRLYRQNDGYYDLDLTTRQETKVADAQLADAIGVVRLPNCIVEVNDQQITLFDGERWRDIQIPEELQGMSFGVTGVASDRILFSHYKAGGVMELYQVMLGQEDLQLEYCGRVT